MLRRLWHFQYEASWNADYYPGQLGDSFSGPWRDLNTLPTSFLINVASVIFITNYYFVIESIHTFYFVMLTMLSFTKLFWLKQRVVNLFTKYSLKMQHSCICQQPNFFWPFQKSWSNMGDKAQNSKRVHKCEDTFFGIHQNVLHKIF